MAGMYGDFTAKYIKQGGVTVTTTWTALKVGTTIMEGRRHIRVFVRGKLGNSLGLAYSNINADGTFTTPTDDIRLVTVLPGNSIYAEPISDKVMVYGKLLNKVAATNGSVRIIVTEYK